MTNSKTKKPRGGQSLGVADSLTSAAGMLRSAGLDWTVAMLKRAKRAGSPAFKSNRVNLDALIDWSKDHAAEIESIGDKSALECRRLAAQCERLERENAVAAGELISLEEYSEINGRIDADICKGLDKLPVEMAPKVFGLKTVAEVTVKLREAVERIKASLYAPIRNPESGR